VTAATLAAPLRYRRVAVVVGGLALMVALAGPAAYTVDTVATATPALSPRQVRLRLARMASADL
jgi:hypothetical protein